MGLSSYEKLDFADFEKVGIVHNQFLTNAKLNFQAHSTISTRKEGIEFVNQFNQAFVDEMDFLDAEKQLIKKSLEENKRFVDTEAFYHEFFISSSNLRSNKYDEQGSLFDDIDEALANDLIDEFEYEKLKLVGLKTKENYEGIVSNDALKSLITDLKDEWLLKGYTEDSKYGRTLAYTLAISIASIEWWEENPDTGFSGSRSTSALPAWAAMDIAGGIIGSVTGRLNSYWSSGSVTWESVGRGALTGAVVGSTGVVGKLGKWINGL